MPNAHPLTGSPPLPVPPLVLAAVAVVLVAVVATRVRSRVATPAEPREPRWLWLPRLAAAAVLVALVVVARAGPVEEPFNLAAVAVPHLLWPLLFVAAAVGGPLVWRAVDPWRALGSVERLFGAPPPARQGVPADPPADAEPDGPAEADAGAGPPVWPAVLTGGAWAAFLGWYTVSYEPRALAAVLAAYTIVLVAGCVALGRDRWLAAADAVGLLVSWTGLLRRGRLTAWQPPPGAAVLLGAVFGGVVFARLRLTGLWAALGVDTTSLRAQRTGAVVAVVLGAALGYGADRWAARRGAAGSVAAALVPVVAATAVATVLRRAMVAAQLVPRLADDPLALGWGLLGPLAVIRPIDVNPWGTAVQQALAAGLLTLGGLAGAWVLARRVRGVRARDPAALAVYVTTFTAVLVVVSR